MNANNTGGLPVPPYGMGGPYGQDPYPSQSLEPKKSSKGKGVLITVVVICLLAAACFFAFGSKMVPSFTKQVGVIHIDGTIGSDAGANTPEGLKSLLDSAEHDASIAAVVLRVDSGGGYSAAGEEMAEYVKDFSKPIVVSTASSNASAAYLISSQSDYIMANKVSSVGAIGAVMQMVDYSDLLEKLGIDMVNITSSGSKDSSYGTRPLTAEELAYYQNLVNQANAVFIEQVAEGRGMSVEEVRALATGMPFSGTDALGNGLVDGIGTFSDACDKAARFAGLSSYSVVSLESGSDSIDKLVDLLGSSSSSMDKVLITEGIADNGTIS